MSCFYFIKNITRLDEAKDLEKWLDSQNTTMGVSKRNFHILKEHKDSLGEDKLVCKISGAFYTVVDNTVYTIGFLHSFKVKFMKATMAKKKTMPAPARTARSFSTRTLNSGRISPN